MPLHGNWLSLCIIKIWYRRIDRIYNDVAVADVYDDDDDDDDDDALEEEWEKRQEEEKEEKDDDNYDVDVMKNNIDNDIYKE